jgi:hypothetical protein
MIPDNLTSQQDRLRSDFVSKVRRLPLTVDPSLLSNGIREVAKGCLTTIWRDARNNKQLTKNEINQNQQGIRDIERGGSRAILRDTGVKALSSLVNQILSIETIGIKLSKSEIERLSEEALFEVLDAEPAEIVSKVDQAIVNLEKRLAESPIAWTLLLPIANLRVDNSLIFGKVTFHPSTSIDLFVEKAKKILGRDELASEDSIRTDFKDFAIAEVEVEAVDRKQAELLGEGRVSDSLNAIRLIYGQFYRDRDMYMDIKGRVWTGTTTFLSLSAKGVSPSFSRAGYLQPVPLSPAILKPPVAKRLHELLRKDPTTWSELEGRIASALRILGHSLNQPLDKDCLVGVISSLEALVLDERLPKKEAISERVAYLTSDTGPRRRGVYSSMKEFYETRSYLVHGRERDVSSMDLLSLIIFAMICIGKALEFVPKMPDDGDFFRWFDEQKFP